MRFVQLQANDVDYIYKTTEKYRVDMHTLQQLPDLLRLTQSWTEMAFKTGIQIRRNHFLQRLHLYLDKQSRNASYVELLPQEYTILQQLDVWLKKHKPPFRVVEVGLNAAYDICKVAVVLLLPETQRHLFLCIGADRGLKTMYVTPEFKFRQNYHSQLQYLSARDVLTMESTLHE